MPRGHVFEAPSAAPTAGLSHVALAHPATPTEPPAPPPPTKEPQGGRVMTREALQQHAEEAAGKQEVPGPAVSPQAREAHGGQPPPRRSRLVLGAASRTRQSSCRVASTYPASDGYE